MFNSELKRAVQEFTDLTLPLTEKDLEHPWVWKDHAEEGIRFPFFVTLQELRHLAVTLAALRTKPTPAQHILSQYHAAYIDLQAVLLGLSAVDAERAPAEGEWSIHISFVQTLGSPQLSVMHCKVTVPISGRQIGSLRRIILVCMDSLKKNMMN